jgi:hypothetical protein
MAPSCVQKADYGDAPMSPADLIKNNYISKEDYEYCAKKTLEVFAFGQAEADKRGLIRQCSTQSS